jgi:hypothetical protein
VRDFDIAISDAAHTEQQLLELLWASGEFIHVSFWGQSQLSEKARDALRHTDSLLRWTPDVLGVTTTNDVVLFDAKSSTERYKDSQNVTVEISAVVALGIYKGMVADALFVFDNQYQATAEQVKAGGRKLEGSSNGSGTPFYLVPKDALDPFQVGSTDMWSLHQAMTNLENGVA